jgi:hypothetical protein
MPSNQLHFINITNPSQRHFAKNRRLVRAQAMRRARRDARASWAIAHQPLRSSERAADADSVGTSPSSSLDDFSDYEFLTRRYDNAIQDEHIQSSTVIRLTQRHPSPGRVLGFGRLDPFLTFPVTLAPYAQFFLDYCKCLLFPSGLLTTSTYAFMYLCTCVPMYCIGMPW